MLTVVVYKCQVSFRISIGNKVLCVCILSNILISPISGIRFSQHEQLCNKKLTTREEELTEKLVKVCQYVNCNIEEAQKMCPEKCLKNKGTIF